MRRATICVHVLALSISLFAQQIIPIPDHQAPPAPAPPASAPASFSEDLKSPATSPEGKLRQMLEQKIETEWEALQKKDKKAYGDLLADDYEGVETDGKGERTRLQAVNEVTEGNVYTYTLWGFKLIPIESDAALAIYEVTMVFPPKSPVRFSRLYITELWMKRAGEWKEVHYQETHVK
jgi:Domain of unknown function (DUF4440)